MFVWEVTISATESPMSSKLILIASIVLVFVGSHLAKKGTEGGLRRVASSAITSPEKHPRFPAQAPLSARRIISIAPSATEVLFALGLGDRVVGVTRYCNYPPQAAAKPRIGGLLDPNFEAIVALRSDLIVMLEGSQENQPAFDRLGLPTLIVNHKSVEGILASITDIGRSCGVAPKAEAIVADIHARLRRVQEQVGGRPQPRVMFCVERTLGAGKIQDVYIAGADGHLDRMVALAGGVNAYQGSVRFPVVSSEGILKLNPEVIIDIVPQLAPGADRQKILADWQQLAQVDAVRKGRVYVLDENYISVPGPRFILVVEKLAQLLHHL
jgi:iron complex transport system substrate-binding protein